MDVIGDRMMGIRTIAVLLTVHNRKEKTLKCLELLYSQVLSQTVNLSVYLTDDGCTDGTPEAIMNLYPDVIIIKGDGTLYWNRGMYVAWKEASKSNPDYYLWLNDDTFIFKNTVNNLLLTSKQYNDKSIVVGSTCATDDKCKITYGGWDKTSLFTDVTKPNCCEMMNGNIVLIPRFVYSILGYNDPYYRHALGDYDYCKQARKSVLSVYTAVGVLGVCDYPNEVSLWKDPSAPLPVRWRVFWTPKGANPIEYFYFRKKNFGLFPACVTFISNFVHLLFPSLWREETL